MRNTLLLLTVSALASLSANGQVELRLSLLPASAAASTYTVFARPQATWLQPTDDLTYSARVTLRVPSGSFSMQNLQNHAGTWALSHLIHSPAESPGVDYAVFDLLEETQAIPWQQGQEVPLFSFQNVGECLGSFELIAPNDPLFSAAGNPMGLSIGSSIVVEGAGGEAFIGNYGIGGANCLTVSNCLIFSRIKLMPDGFYELSLEAPQGMDSVANLQLTLKVPTGQFQLHGLGHLQPGQLSFNATARYNSPAAAPNFDYLTFRLAATQAAGFSLPAGITTPILRFANAGSCPGDLVFLFDNALDPFLPPNSQQADVAQKITRLGGLTLGICGSEADAAPCSGCLFTPDVLEIDSIFTMPAAECMGYQNGMLKVFAQGAANLEFSLDGQVWSAQPVFSGLGAGTYLPRVRGTHWGCPVFAEGEPSQVGISTEMSIALDFPAKACAGDDLALRILSPAQFPDGTSFAWTGPIGFTASFADPVLFNLNTFQSGTYTLTVNAPGCNQASAYAVLQVLEPPAVPVVLGNAPICQGDTLRLQTAASGAQYEWFAPNGLPVMSGPDSLVFFPKNHPSYLPGEWRLRLSDAQGCHSESEPLVVHIKPRPTAFAENTGPVCAGADVQLLGNPMPNASYLWRKAGQNAIFSMQPDPTIANLGSPETFTLSLIYEGCVSDNLSSTTVGLHPKVTANPSSDYTLAVDCSPEALQFSANPGSGVGLSFEWTGTGGFLSQLENPQIAEANASHNGSYLLKVTDWFGCQISQALAVEGVVDALPVPQVLGSAPACPGETMLLQTTAYQGFAVNYQWYKNNVAVAGGQASQLFLPNVQEATEGLYRVKVTVDDCVLNSQNYTLNTMDAPPASPDFYLSDACEGGVLHLFSNIVGTVNWHWTGPSGFTSDAANPIIYSVEFENVGAYAVTVTGSNGCASHASVIVDGILELPEQPVVLTNSPVCPDGEILLTVQNPPLDGSVFFEWLNADGEQLDNYESSLQLSPGDTLAKPPFLVKTWRNGCPSSLSDPVLVEVEPAPVAVAGNSGAACPGAEVQLFAAPVQDGTYEWRSGGQSLGFGQNISLTLSDTTTYELIVKTLDCQLEASTWTTVPTVPSPQISGLNGGGSFCEGATLALSAENSALLSGPVQYEWAGPNGFSFIGSEAPTGSFPLLLSDLGESNEGSYTLTLTSAEGCASEPQSVAVSVAPMPQPPVLGTAENVLCQGETLQFDLTPAAGQGVSYHWFFQGNSGDSLLAVTAFPTLFLPSAIPAQSGVYFAEAAVDGCASSPSNLVPVTVTAAMTNLLASNSTLMTPTCAGGSVELSVPFVPGASYYWTGPAGFTSEVSNPLIVNAQALQSGSYTLVVGQPGCSLALTSSTEVFVAETPAVPLLNGATKLCEGEPLSLGVVNVQPGVSYDFFAGQNLLATNSTGNFTLPNATPDLSGNYAARASANGCLSALSELFHLTVDALPSNLAAGGADQTLCPDEQEAVLLATPPSIGGGEWRSLDGAILVNPGSPSTAAMSLQTGENRFIWALSNGACVGYASDTLLIFRRPDPEAMPDELSLPADSNLLDINLLENDLLENSGDWSFAIFSPPSKGFLDSDGDGMVSYRPFPNAFGFDGFAYRLCLEGCPSACDTALVSLRFGEGSSNSSACFVPNLITPNGDGENETLIIPCTLSQPGNALTVFNRYGAKVFQSADYQNDWAGDYEGAPLPVGTYFYQLALNDATGTVLNGYVVVMR